MNQFPESDLPYINLGNYYYMAGDTSMAVQFFEEAVEKSDNPAAGKFLSNYYSKRGDHAKAAYYLKKSKAVAKKKED
jgi:tetratricopeptide (TPR) repeat protein